MGRPKYFLGIEIAHQKQSMLFLNESMRWIFWRSQDFWGANLLALQWKPIWTCALMTVTHLISRKVYEIDWEVNLSDNH